MKRSHLGFLLATLLVLSLAAGIPARLGYVTSGSMEPTLSSGDGYVLVTVTDPEPGDIVVYRSEVRDQLVAHRIVEETASGFITKGDANPTSDQATGAPPVEEAQVLGTMLTLGGEPLVIPGLGWLFVRTPLGLGVAALVAALLLTQGRDRTPNRQVTEVRDVIYPLFAVAVVLCLTVLLVTTGVSHLTWEVVDGPVEDSSELPAGEAANRTIHVNVTKLPITHVVVEAEKMTVREQSMNGSALTMQVRFPPRGRGTFETSVRTYPYPATLPKETTVALHQVHPLAALVGSLSTVFAPLFGAYAVFLYGRTPLRLGSSRWLQRFGGDSR